MSPTFTAGPPPDATEPLHQAFRRLDVVDQGRRSPQWWYSTQCQQESRVDAPSRAGIAYELRFKARRWQVDDAAGADAVADKAEPCKSVGTTPTADDNRWP